MFIGTYRLAILNKDPCLFPLLHDQCQGHHRRLNCLNYNLSSTALVLFFNEGIGVKLDSTSGSILVNKMKRWTFCMGESLRFLFVNRGCNILTILKICYQNMRL